MYRRAWRAQVKLDSRLEGSRGASSRREVASNVTGHRPQMSTARRARPLSHGVASYSIIRDEVQEVQASDRVKVVVVKDHV